MLNIVMLSVFVLNVIMLSVLAPFLIKGSFTFELVYHIASGILLIALACLGGSIYLCQGAKESTKLAIAAIIAITF
jgi:hypothetical protein